MTTFSLEKIISANRDSVFEIFSNYENYQKIFPQHYPSIRIRSVRDNVAVVEEHVNFGSEEFLIMAKHVSNKSALHEVFVIGGDIKGSYFKQQFVDLPQGTKVIVDVQLKFGKLKIKKLFGASKYAQYYEDILNDFVKMCEN
ncbi:SRPBCC family protein [Nitrosopumilus sp.]|uniref:SRPBCC family protein n=1 Tax=Nitrosopumilus sp. TaxID=2024843 RepID=UPI002612C166|nr:SRPBCC family protein [Nitrosopumilus sp.]